jgi:hypothetical protein
MMQFNDFKGIAIELHQFYPSFILLIDLHHNQYLDYFYDVFFIGDNLRDEGIG